MTEGGGALAAEMAAHVAGCDGCRELERQVRENLTFMRGVLEELGDRAKPGVTDLGAAPDPDALPGYSLTREIARGGQGTVYEGLQLATRRRVAVKIIDAGMRGARGRRRIEREVEIAAGLRHPNIVTVYHSAVLPDGRYALAMEFVDGLTLDLWARSVDEAAEPTREGYREAVRAKLRAMSAVCEAVQYAHHNGVIHRDLKPANVIVGGDGTPRVVDFGIARRTTHAHTITRTGAFAGTLAYASPEQVSGTADAVDTRSDVYSLGLILYELLAMRRPYDTEGSLTGAIANITSTEPAPLRVVEPGAQVAGAELEAIVRTALAKDRAMRYQTAAALRTDIQNWLEGRAVEARRESSVYMLRKAAAKHRVPVAIVSGFVLLLAAFAISTAMSSRKLARQGQALSDNLFSSTIERGRLVGRNEDLSRAEQLIWPELLRAGGDVGDPELGFGSSVQATQATWALRELYGRQASALNVPVSRGALGSTFDADGTSLRVVYADGRHEVRDGAEGRLVRTIPAPGVFAAKAMSFSAGRRRATLFGGDEVLTLDLVKETGEVFRDPELREVTYIDTSVDGERMITVDGPQRLLLWSTHPPKLLKTLAQQMLAFGRAQFTDDGTMVVAGVVGGGGASVRAWRASDGETVREWPIPQEILAESVRPGIVSARLSPDGSQMVAAFTTSVLIFDARDTSKPPVRMEAHRGYLNNLRYSSDGRVLMTSGQEESFKFWDPLTMELKGVIEPGVRPMGPVELSGDGAALTFCDTRATLRLLEATPRSWVTFLEGPENTVNRVVFGPGSTFLAAASGDGRVWVWNAVDKSLRWKSGVIGAPMNALSVSPDGATVAAIGEDGTITRLDAATGEVRGATIRAVVRPTWIGYSADGKLIGVAGGEPHLQLFDATTGELRGTLAGAHTRRIAEAAFSADGKSVVTVAVDGLCVMWDLASGKERYRISQGDTPVRSVSLSADGKLIATGNDARRICLWDASSGEHVRTFSDAKQHVFGLAFHPGGNLLFSCCRDVMVQVWDVRTGQEIAELVGHTQVVPSLSLSPDGRYLAAGSSDRTVGVWDLKHYDAHLRGNAPAWMEWMRTGVTPGARAAASGGE